MANTAAALGPPIGGPLVEYASWHWIFRDDKGWGSTEIVSLFVAAAVLTVAFVLSQRLGKWPMLVADSLPPRVMAIPAMLVMAVRGHASAVR